MAEGEKIVQINIAEEMKSAYNTYKQRGMDQTGKPAANWINVQKSMEMPRE